MAGRRGGRRHKGLKHPHKGHSGHHKGSHNGHHGGHHGGHKKKG